MVPSLDSARLINPATGVGLGRLAGRAVPAWRDRPAAGTPITVPATLTTRPRARVQETWTPERCSRLDCYQHPDMAAVMSRWDP